MSSMFIGACLRKCKNRGERCNDCFGFSDYDGDPIKKVATVVKTTAGSTGEGVVDIKGNPQRLSSYQKNNLYGQAKQLKSEIESVICTKDECYKPTDKNAHKMLNGEFKIKKKIETFKKCMRAIGADPREHNVEKLRR